MLKYTASFSFKGYTMKVEEDDIDKLKHGFYIDKQYRWTSITDLAAYWIPGHKINHIKMEDD